MDNSTSFSEFRNELIETVQNMLKETGWEIGSISSMNSHDVFQITDGKQNKYTLFKTDEAFQMFENGLPVLKIAGILYDSFTKGKQDIQKKENVSVSDSDTEAAEPQEPYQAVAGKMKPSENISLQTSFQDIVSTMRKNGMDKEADSILQLGNYLDDMKQRYDNLSGQMEKLKDQLKAMEDRILEEKLENTQSDIKDGKKTVDTARLRFCNAVDHARTDIKENAQKAVVTLLEKIKMPNLLNRINQSLGRAVSGIEEIQDRISTTREQVHHAMLDIKNAQRAISGKKMMAYMPWDPEKGIAAGVQKTLYVLQKSLEGMQSKTKAVEKSLQASSAKLHKRTERKRKKGTVV